MSQDEFTRLFQYMQQNMATKDDLAGIGKLQEDITKVLHILDQHTALLETHELERHALNAQVERDEKHIAQLAEKTKMKLDYSI